MIRPLLGLVGAVAILAVGGAGLLLLTGVWSQCRGVIRVAVAGFVGFAAAAVVLPWLVYARVGAGVAVVACLAAAVFVAGLVVHRRRARATATAVGAEKALLLLLVPLALLAVRAAVAVHVSYDAISNWVLKAKRLYYAGGWRLDPRIFEAAFAQDGSPPVERVYPLGLPAVEAFVMHAMGAPSVRVLHLLFVVVLFGFCALVWLVLRPHVPAWPLAAGLALLASIPAVRDQTVSAGADMTLACVFVASALLLARFVSAEDRGTLVLAIVFAAAAVAMKREGAVFVLLAFVVAIALRPARWRTLAGAAVAVAATAVPWRVFVAVNDLTGHDVSVSPRFILDHLGELPLVLRELAEALVSRQFVAVVPVTVVVALLLLRRPESRRLAAGYLGLVAAMLATLVVVYLNSRPDTAYLLRSSAHRTLLTPAILAASFLPLLVVRLTAHAPGARPTSAAPG